ncbi:RNA ligase family protein [Vitiosangium sp. GDMCC 1.1324]|uniref:RNA ligase family protein n=1 Tax=Vitiosangium sp. (strain GDMCC 1.1324) TaxID=2138576 RepID=UPI000D37BDE8|nr:RNA ligase family protein [Vitiosangium sp. GDMCC 1.1324]PTL83495.1 RNA ligase [Vitiosangium sp. GDMCC 1.1324]
MEQPPRFRPYAKMPASGEPRSQPSPGGPWIALEKIHGAQLVIAVRAGQVWFGKRKAWLSEEESFFGWQLLRAPLGAAAQRMTHALKAEASTVYFYGELFGGHYPHPAVPSVPGLSAVQTGIWYAPDLNWSPFDVLVARDDEDEGTLLAHHELEAVASDAGVLTPPVLRRGTRADMDTVPTRGPTRVPGLLGLPPIADNVAEGLVIKSDQRAPPNARASVKRKITEFNEGRFDESEAWDPHQPLSVEALADWSARLVNPARIASALSKCGRDRVEPLLDEVVLDVLMDLELAFPLAYRSLDAEAEDFLSAQIRERALPLIQAALAPPPSR